MEEETTTEAPVESGVQEINGIPVDGDGNALTSTQPEEQESAEAETETTETEPESEETNEPEQSAATEVVVDSETEQLDKFAKSKGLILDSENARKAAKMAMNAERQMHTKAQRASELEKTMGTMSDESATQVAYATGQDPELLKRLQRMEVKDSIRDFWESNPDAKVYETDMAKIATESGLYGTPEAILKASYAMARANNPDALKSQVKRDTLKSLAQKQQAAVPTGNAVTSGVSSGKLTAQNVDSMVAKMTPEEYRRRLPEINKVMAI